MRLYAIRRAGGGTNRPPKQNVVREHDISGQQLAKRGCVRLDIVVSLRPREVLQKPRLNALIAVEHKDRQQAAGQLGPDNRGATKVVQLGVVLLTDNSDIVARQAPFTR